MWKCCINHEVWWESNEVSEASFQTWTCLDLLNSSICRMNCLGMERELLLFDLQKDHSHHYFATKVPGYFLSWDSLELNYVVPIALLCSLLMRFVLLCSLAAPMLRLKMLLPVELLFCVASMMILILHRHQGPDLALITDIQMRHWKIVLQILLRFYLSFI